MSTKTEGRHAEEFLVSEANGTRSRDQVTATVAASTTLAPGSVLAKLTATGKYVPYDNAGSDGSETAFGVLAHELINAALSPADAQATVINADAEVRLADLQWNGVDASGQAAGLVDLRVNGIKAR